MGADGQKMEQIGQRLSSEKPQIWYQQGTITLDLLPSKVDYLIHIRFYLFSPIHDNLIHGESEWIVFILQVPDIYDCIKYDLQHNMKILRFPEGETLHALSKSMADIVIPQVRH